MDEVSSILPCFIKIAGTISEVNTAGAIKPMNLVNLEGISRLPKEEEKLTSPYTCLGLADVQSHYGSAPISIVWKMKESLPGFVMKKTVKV